LVVVRGGAGQVLVDEELYVRLAGDGLIVATPLGSSAYSMAAGGPVLASGTPAVVCTPLAMHGGNAPPIVVPATSRVRLEVHPGFGGFGIELDGHAHPRRLGWREATTARRVGIAAPVRRIHQRRAAVGSPPVFMC
jgi:NAD kinase